MAMNFFQIDTVVTIPAPADVASGGVVVAGALAGVAQGDAASGEPVDVALTGVWQLPKVAANAIAVGAPVYWNATTKLVTTTASGNTRVGTAIEAAAAGSATAKVRLVQL